MFKIIKHTKKVVKNPRDMMSFVIFPNFQNNKIKEIFNCSSIKKLEMKEVNDMCWIDLRSSLFKWRLREDLEVEETLK